MNQSDFSISSIELSHDQAKSLYQRIVDAIENHGIENFEKKTEIQVPELADYDNDMIKIYVEMETYTEWKDDKRHQFDTPEPEEITSRSVMKLNIQLINTEGNEVKFKVIGEKERSFSGREYTKSPFNIYEEVIKHFSI